VLVDSLGLARFRPAPRFALTLVGFQARPSERTYNRFMRQCSYDLNGLREEMGELWEPFAAYNVDLAQGPGSKAVGRMLREVGIPRIPDSDLARISAPTTLIWGRQDRANRLRIAEAARDRYGWPLHVIEDCADDPARDRPEAFLRALRAALTRGRIPDFEPTRPEIA
jgi:pimeloyl-ACP methyl ester carboxylesterase